MTEHIIKFNTIEWEEPGMGVMQKVYSNGHERLRLLRFSDNFIEEEWCMKGHVGYILSGEMKINFDGDIKEYREGDGLWIIQGEASKHKVIIEKGREVELIVFESENKV